MHMAIHLAAVETLTGAAQAHLPPAYAYASVLGTSIIIASAASPNMFFTGQGTAVLAAIVCLSLFLFPQCQFAPVTHFLLGE